MEAATAGAADEESVRERGEWLRPRAQAAAHVSVSWPPLPARAIEIRLGQAITYRFWAEHLGVSLDTLTVRVEGDLDIRGFFGFDDDVRPGFTAVRVAVSVTGPETAQRCQELATAVDEHCPVLDLFRNPVPVDRTITAGLSPRLRASCSQFPASVIPADARSAGAVTPVKCSLGDRTAESCRRPTPAWLWATSQVSA